MTRLIAAVWAALYFATVRTQAHPLLIDAKADDRFCDVKPGGPLIAGPRGRYDYQPGRRRTGDVA